MRAAQTAGGMLYEKTRSLSGPVPPALPGELTIIDNKIPGSLTLKAPSYDGALSVFPGTLTLKEADLTVCDGIKGIQGGPGSKLVAENSTVHVDLTEEWNSAITAFDGGIQLIGCHFTVPTDGEIKDGSIVKSDGSNATQVTIRPLKPVTGVTLDRTSLTLAVGNSKTLTAALTPSDASNQSVVWESSTPSVAAVDAGGTVTGVSKGTATITVKTSDGGKTATCEVSVVTPVPVTGVTLSRSEMTIAVNSVVFLTAAVSPGNATEQAVTWSSDNPAVAKVSLIGQVTAVSAGIAKITAKTADGGKPMSCVVTVTQPWSFDKAAKSITVTSSVSEASPVIVASYNDKGQFLGSTFVTKNTSSVVKGGAKYVKSG